MINSKSGLKNLLYISKMRILRHVCSLFSLVLITMLISASTSAQNPAYERYEHWYLGLSLGSSNFYGDISERSRTFSSPLFTDRNFLYGITLTKKFNNIFGARLNLLTGTFDDSRDELNFYFRSEAIEFSGIAMFSITGIILGNDPDRMINAYLFFGPGIIRYRSWKKSLTETDFLETEGTEGKKSTDFAIPIGFGVDYRLTDQFTITGELSFRNVRSDRMDAHTDDSRLQEGYGYINLGLHYQFDMPEGVFRRNSRYTGKSTDPAIRAYNKRKATVMKTKAYRDGLRAKRIHEREKKDWLIFKLFKKTRLDMATE